MTPGDRSLFPDLAWRVYVNHAAIGPLATPTRQAASAAHALQATQGVGGILDLLSAADASRAAFGRLIRSARIDIGLTRNTSDGVTSVALCHPYQSGDAIILFRGEFPTNITPWQRAAALHDLSIIWLEVEHFRGPSGKGLAELEAALTAHRVAIVAVSAVQFQTGLRMPVTEIAALAHAHGAAIFVDAIQATGCVPLSVKEGDIDYLATGGQKWLMGPIGTGFLYARRDRWRDLSPHLASWLSHEDPLVFLQQPHTLRYDRGFQTNPARIEGGTQNLPGHAALASAIDLAVEITPQVIFEHVQRYHDLLEPGLCELGFVSRRSEVASQRSGILSLQPPDGHHPAPLVAALAERGISASSPDGHVRFSPSWPNALDEVDHILEAMREILRPGPATATAQQDPHLLPDLIDLAFEGAVPPRVQGVMPPPGTDYLGLRYKAAPILEIGGRGATRAFVANTGEDEAFVARILSQHSHPEIKPFLSRVGSDARKIIDTDGEVAQLFLDDLHCIDHDITAPEGVTLMCETLAIPTGVRTWLSRHDTPPFEHLSEAWRARLNHLTEAGFRGRWGLRWRDGEVHSILYINEERWTGDPERSALLVDRLEDPRWRAMRERARKVGWRVFPDSIELHLDGQLDITIGIIDPAEVTRR